MGVLSFDAADLGDGADRNLTGRDEVLQLPVSFAVQ
jgi:hypothetical protein